jgi:uncharacterized protein (DUF1800 family)
MSIQEWLAPFEPTASDPWNRRKVAHLYRRAGFGANWIELENGVRMGPSACVDRLLAGTTDATVREEDFAAIARTAISTGSDRNLQGWWFFRMLAGGHPLVERMTLFWHNHFATSQDKVANLALMHEQNELFRRFALGRFWDASSGGLLLAVSRNPAMLVWLDSNSNRRAAPNENYAREIMELFALGIGNYSEKDIREAARAFSGWFVNKSQFLFVAAEHDSERKTVLGQTGDWDGGDVVRIVAQQPAAAAWIARKLYRFLVSENVSTGDAAAAPRDSAAVTSERFHADVQAALTNGFREHEYDVRWLVETILRSKLFYSSATYRQKIASPVDFTIGTVRRLEGSRVSPALLSEISSKLGQTLFHPPNVAGWEEGRAWINSSTLLGRANFAQEIVASRGGRFPARIDPAALAAKYGASNDDHVLEFFLNLLVDDDVPAETRAELRKSLDTPVASPGDSRNERIRRLVQLILSLPEYNLC